MTATPTEAIRATSICCFSVIFPSLMISPYISCAKADADVKTRPDTTAKIVANATAETNANKNSPPMVNARRGAAMFSAEFAATIRSKPTKDAAPKPRKIVMMKNTPINHVEYTTDFLAVAASFTVKKRTSKCGRPAAPKDKRHIK